jgi:hypothetical protein
LISILPLPAVGAVVAALFAAVIVAFILFRTDRT